MLQGIAEWAERGKRDAAAVFDSMQQNATDELPKPKQTWKEYAGRTTGPEGYSMGDITRHMAKKTKESVVDSIKGRVHQVMQSTYVDRVKPRLTADDKAMPMFVRRALHELADEFWETLNSASDAHRSRARARRARAGGAESGKRCCADAWRPAQARRRGAFGAVTTAVAA